MRQSGVGARAWWPTVAVACLLAAPLVAGLADGARGASTRKASGPSAPAGITDGLLAYWKFDGDADDASGTGRNLVLHNGLGFGSGLFGQAVDFVGDQRKYAMRPVDDAAFDFGAGAFSVQTWIYYDGPVDDLVFLDKSDCSGGWTLAQSSDDRISLGVTTPVLTIAPNTWHQVVFRRSGTDWEIYFDSQSAVSGLVASSPADSTLPLLLGRRTHCDGRVHALDGLVDEVAIWSRRLTIAEIGTLWNSGAGYALPVDPGGAATSTPTPTPTPAGGYIDGLEAYWHFDGDAVDASPAGRDLTLKNGLGFGTGLFGEALDFPRDNQKYAMRPVDDAAFDFDTGDVAIQLWLNFHDTAGSQVLVEKWDGGFADGWTILKQDDDSFRFGVDSPPVAISTGAWHQVVARRSGAVWEIFLDSSRIVWDRYPGAVGNAASGLVLGRRNPLDGRQFPLDALVDEVAFWSRRLSDQEIAYLYNDGAGRLVNLDPPTATPTPTNTPTPTPGPHAVVSPEAIGESLPEATVETIALAIENDGSETLTFALAERADLGGSTLTGAFGRPDEATGAKSHPPLPARGPTDDPRTVDAAAAPRRAVMSAELSRAIGETDEGEMVPFIAYLGPAPHLSAAASIEDWSARGRYVVDGLRQAAASAQRPLLDELEHLRRQGDVRAVEPFFVVNAVYAEGQAEAVRAVAGAPGVMRLDVDPALPGPPPVRAAAFAVAGAPQSLRGLGQGILARTPGTAGIEWNIARIGADKVWSEQGVTGDGVVVGAIDTGVDYLHPALHGQYRGTATGSHDYNWFDATGTFPSAPGDDRGHGTHVMGIAVGSDGASHRIGVAPGARWIAAKACTRERCYRSDLYRAAEWMLAPCTIGDEPGSASCDPAKRPHVVNNSWGGQGGDDWANDVVDAWRAAGIFPAFAIGNSGAGGELSSMSSPSDYGGSFATGASDGVNAACWFSGRGPSALAGEIRPNLVAPGCYAILSSVPGGGYATSLGSSMASPHTTGAVALLLEANPSLVGDMETIESLLESTARDVAARGPDYDTGYGLLDASGAAKLASDLVPWLAIEPTEGTVAPGERALVTVTLNTRGLIPFTTRRANLLVNTNAQGSLTVPVTIVIDEPAPYIRDVRISNLADTSTSVSWITSRKSYGIVRYGTSPSALGETATDDRGPGTVDDAHHVTISGLAPSTTYYFEVESGFTVGRDGDEPFSLTTAPSIGAPGLDAASGKVYSGDGTTLANNALLFATIIDGDGLGNVDDSATISGIVRNGYWTDPLSGGALNLAAVRTDAGTAYYSYSAAGDRLRVEIQGGDDCEAMVLVDTGQDDPAPDIVLSCLDTIKWDIKKGLNSITLPGQGGTNAEELLQLIGGAGPGCNVQLSRWKNAHAAWQAHVRDVPMGDFATGTGEPYLVQSTCRGLLEVPADFAVILDPSIELSPGWNFIRLQDASPPIHASDVCAQVVDQGGAIDRVARWDNPTTNWVVKVCSVPGDFQIGSGEGYFVRSASESTWMPALPEEGAVAAALSQTNRRALERVSQQLLAIRSDPHPTISDVRMANLGDRSATFTWTTDRPSTGAVRFGSVGCEDANLAQDDRAGPTRNHQVTVSGLSPETRYRATIVSGKTVDGAAGERYEFTTLAAPRIPPVDAAYGRVLLRPGLPARDATVSLTLERRGADGRLSRAGTLASRTDEGGYWTLNMGAARAEAGGAPFDLEGDVTARLVVQDGGLVLRDESVGVRRLRAGLDTALRTDGRIYLPWAAAPARGELHSASTTGASIASLRLGNVTTRSFAVSWESDAVCAGSIAYGTTLPSVTQLDDPGLGPYVHHVTVAGLTPGATYLFDVQCGSTTDDNGGTHYQLTLPPSGSVPAPPDLAYGPALAVGAELPAAGSVACLQIVDDDGTGSPGASSWLTGIVDDAGYWSLDLASAMVPPFTSLFQYAPEGTDDLELTVLAGNDGSADLAVDVGDSHQPGAVRSSLPGITLTRPLSYASPADCNGDAKTDAGDLSAAILEIFDGDGAEPGDANGGSFPGHRIGCNANEDYTIDAGDISCIVLTIFGGPGACGR